MKLERSVSSVMPAPPDHLKNRVYFATTCALSDDEILAFLNVYSGLDKLLVSDESVNPNAYISIICTDSDTFSLTLDPGFLGNQINLAILPIHRWRERNLSIMQMETCIAEELCHYFWNIRDENLVQFQVLSLLRHIHPNAQLSDAYNPHWKPDDN